MPHSKLFISIIWLRAIATLLITNSHCSALYPSEISFLSFGGFFGNCIFFLVSGFCLVNPKRNFLQFNLHRITRIYIPYILFLPVLFLLGELSNVNLFNIFIPINMYHFIPTIITLYPIYYVCCIISKKGTKIQLHTFLYLSIFIQFIYYLFFYNYSYAVTDHYKFLPMNAYFQLMLVGGIFNVTNIQTNINSKKHSLAIKCTVLLLVFISFVLYGIQSLGYFNIPILQLFIGQIFAISISLFFIIHENSLVNNKYIAILAKLTLEIYIVQIPIIKAFSYLKFPGGIILAAISIVATAYCLNHVSLKIYNIRYHATSYFYQKIKLAKK